MIDGWPPRLTIDIEPVLQLFTGENFYSSADAALREGCAQCDRCNRATTAGEGLSRRLLNLAERGGSGAQHTACATVVKIAEARA